MRQPPALFRWLVLIVISLAMFGNYYLYDSIAPVADLLDSQLGFSDTMIGWLYSSYSISSIVALIIGGVLIDRFGTRITILMFGSLCTLAGFITMISGNIIIMVSGRALLGIGAEPLIVAITVAIAKWFRGKELAFALGVNLFIARAGSYFADRSPDLLKSIFDHWRPPLQFGAIVGLLCIVCGIIYYFQEYYGKKKYVMGEGGETDKLSFSNLNFSKSYWLIVLLCFTFYSAVFPFRTFAIKYFIEFNGLLREDAGNLLSNLPMTAMIATPLIGLLVDIIGKRATLMAVGSLLFMPVFLIFAYTSVNLQIPVSMLGLAYSLIPAIMWPSVAYVVEEKNLGKAYAFMTVLQQGGVAAMNWILGYSNDVNHASASNPEGYIPMMLILSSLSILALIFSIFLRRIEKRPGNHRLEEPALKLK